MSHAHTAKLLELSTALHTSKALGQDMAALIRSGIEAGVDPAEMLSALRRLDRHLEAGIDAFIDLSLVLEQSATDPLSDLVKEIKRKAAKRKTAG